MKKNKYLILLILIDILLCIFIFRSGIAFGHDLDFHLSRIQGLADSMNSGSIMSYIHVGLKGYGYANGLFYGNLFLYLPSLLVMIGLNVITSYKVLILILMISTSLIMYYTTNKIFKDEKLAFIASLLYTTCAYHMTDVVIRAALGEVIAYAIAPIILLGLYYIIFDDDKKWPIFAIGFVLLVNCHLLTTILMIFACIIVIVLNIKKIIKEKRLKYFIYSFILGLLLGAFFILPFLEQYMSGQFVVSEIKSHLELRAVPISKLFLGFRIGEIDDPLFVPAGIGLVFVITSILRFKIKEKNKFVDTCLIVGLISLVATTNIFPWRLFEGTLAFIQFPWRLYLLATLFLSISSAYILTKLIKNKNVFILLSIYVVAIGFVISYQAYTGAGYYNLKTLDYYTVHGGEYLPLNTDLEKLDKSYYTNNENLIYQADKDNLKITIEYQNGKDSYLEVPILYYKGYVAESLNTKEQYKIEKGTNNVIRINLKDQDKIIVYYKGTKIQKISLFISIITLIVVLVRWLYEKKK